MRRSSAALDRAKRHRPWPARLPGRSTPCRKKYGEKYPAELAILDTHRAAWHDGLKKTVDETFEFAVPLAVVRVPGEKPTTEKSPAAPADLTDLWNRHGIGVTATWAARRNAGPVQREKKTSQLVTLVPDLVTLSVVQYLHDVRVVTATSRHLVMDDRSHAEYHLLEKSLFGRRSPGLTFDADAARLQRLKQLRDILETETETETETAIGKADPRLLAAIGPDPVS